MNNTKTKKLIKSLDSDFFKVLAEPVRIEIIKVLTSIGKADIASIAEHLPQDRSVISRHLQQMANVKLLHTTKQSRSVYYEINALELVSRFENILENIRSAIPECCPPANKQKI